MGSFASPVKDLGSHRLMAVEVVAAVATEMAAQAVAIDLVVGAAAIVVAVEVVATVVEIAEALAIVGDVADRVD